VKMLLEKILDFFLPTGRQNRKGKACKSGE